MQYVLQYIQTMHRDQAGQTTVEWTLLIAAFGIPMIFVFALTLSLLSAHYRMMTFLLTLPLP
jgi:Flp pilus assembly pilin Flp